MSAKEQYVGNGKRLIDTERAFIKGVIKNGKKNNLQSTYYRISLDNSYIVLWNNFHLGMYIEVN